MKSLKGATIGLVCLTALFHGINTTVRAQSHAFRRTAAEYGIIPMFTNNPAAMYVITNLLNDPMPELAVPNVSQTNRVRGTYWTLKGPPVPLPFDPYPELDIYQVGTNDNFIIDDRSVDYQALSVLQEAQAQVQGLNVPTLNTCPYCNLDLTGLWLEVPTNSLATPDSFTAVIHNTIEGQSYDMLTTSDLLGSWATEMVVTGAVGNITPVQLKLNSRANLYLRTRTRMNFSFYLVEQPLPQHVLDADTVTFRVGTSGNTNLMYQWIFNGTPIDGANNSSYTMENVQESDAGDYACIISDGTNTLITSAAHLQTLGPAPDAHIMPVVDERQDYDFKGGMTYYLDGTVKLHGQTTIEAGAVLKFDWNYNATLQILGSLTCKGTPYSPAILTSVDEDSIGQQMYDPYTGALFSSEDGPVQPYPTGVPYLDLSCAKSNVISNLRVEYADWGITTPVQTRRLDVWDCQFLQCNYGIVNLVDGLSTNDLHNVLFSACGAAVGAATNAITIEAEHVTADAGDFCLAACLPNRIALTNCIIWGDPPMAASLSTVQSVFNPDPTNFQTSGAGIYYLAGSSPLHRSGTTGVSPQLLNEFHHKSTYAPLALPPKMPFSGSLTLAPQTPRYTNGAPDAGYYYDTLDYTVAGVKNFGNITVLPDTAIGFRRDYVAAITNWTAYGFELREESTFTSHGLPNKPVIFADAQQVQEQQAWPCLGEFVADFEGAPDDPAPTLDFRFGQFFPAANQYEVWAGYDEDGYLMASPDSAVNWTMQDCELHNGKISLGEPDYGDVHGIPYTTYYGSGTVTWNNNLFENERLNLQPSYNWLDPLALNVDLAFQARNNLFRGGDRFVIVPVAASAGNWTMTDNLFDQVDIFEFSSLPLDFDHNGYWPLRVLYYNEADESTRLIPSVGGNLSGANDLVLGHAPPYQAGPFGNYYLNAETPLWQAGSRTATEAGLSQYTAFINQGKDSASQPVNIGLHYVAATNALALDSDGDGVPDYVEAEHGTDLNNAMTDGSTPDALNEAYDDVDLSGNGLVGRIKKAIGHNPLDGSNPLIAIQGVVAAESGLASIEVPVSYNILTNIGRLKLVVDGAVASFQDCNKASNGHCVLVWNTTFDAPGQHYLQVQLLLNGQQHQGSTPDPTILIGVGKLNAFTSTNVCQFEPFYSSFDSHNGAILYAKTPACPDADYTIELQTASGAHIKTITNSTSTGEISEHWDLTDDNGNIVTNADIKAIFNVTLLDPDEGSLDFWLHRSLLGSEDGNFTVAYTWDVDQEAVGKMRDAIEYGVVDPLMAPLETGGGGSENPYDSTFNEYTWSGDLNGNPGYIANQSDVKNLMTNLTDVDTMNFYFDGHGSPSTLGDDKRSQVGIFTTSISFALGNRFSAAQGMQCAHPYRFVFLNACDTADDHDWAHAFGILDIISPAQVAVRPLGAQAFLGWIGEPRAPSGDDWDDMVETFAVFFEAWQYGYNLKECVALATSKHPYGSDGPTLNFPLGKKFGWITTNFTGTNAPANNFDLKIYGYPLIKREGYDTPFFYEKTIKQGLPALAGVSIQSLCGCCANHSITSSDIYGVTSQSNRR